MSTVAGALGGDGQQGGAGAQAGAGEGGQSGADGGAGGGGTGAGQSGDGSAAGADGGAGSIPAWMTGLPDDYRNDPDLTRYQSVEDLAKGMKETRAWARGRVPVPQDEAGWKEFGEKLRPESPDAYKIDLPEGDSGVLANAYRQYAFDEGMPAYYAEKTAAFWNRQQAEMKGKIISDNQDQLKALDLELGSHGYNVRIEAARNMLASAGIDAEASDVMVRALEQTHGAGKTMRALFTLAEKTGELEKVDSTTLALNMGGMQPEAAQAEINKLMGDKDFMAKAREKGTPENAKWARLNKAAAGGK